MNGWTEMVSALSGAGIVGLMTLAISTWGKRREVKDGSDRFRDDELKLFRAELREENRELRTENREIREELERCRERCSEAFAKVSVLTARVLELERRVGGGEA